MKTHFKKSGWIYIPNSNVGWIVVIIYVAVSIVTLIAIDWHYNSLTSTIIRFFPYFISYSVIYFWIALNSSGKDS